MYLSYCVFIHERVCVCVCQDIRTCVSVYVYIVCVSRAGPAEKGYNKNVTEKNNSRYCGTGSRSTVNFLPALTIVVYTAHTRHICDV